MMQKRRFRLDKVVLSFALMAFIASLIIFDLDSNVIYSNVANLVLWSSFVFWVGIKNKVIKNPIFNRYLVFSIFAFVSGLWAYDVNLVLDFSLRLIVIIINLNVLFVLFQKYDLKQTFLLGIIIGSIYNYLIVLNIIHVSYETYEFSRFLGSVGNPNKLSKIMLLSIFASLMLLLIKERNYEVKLLLYINCFFALFIIILTASKQALFLGPILMIFSTKIKDIKIIKLLFYAFIIFVVIDFTQKYISYQDILSIIDLVIYRFEKFANTVSGHGDGVSTIERTDLITEGLKQFYKHPLFGSGMNNFRYFFTKYAHNTYLELLVGLGIVGTCLFYSIHFIIIKKIINMKVSKSKTLFYTLITVILIMDLVTVTYLDKLIIFTLLFIYTIALKDEKAIL